ncbi:MAG: SpoIID/LytB domain-containing protein [Lachnospiraceae bacterium]|nr:SpoIID/LytB domain-containing protein [Lachnospiraceae bacterium]
MDKKIQIIQLKILLVILEIFLVLLIWTLVQLIFKPKQEAEIYQAGPSQDVQEAFREQTGTEVKVPEPTPTPFVLTNIDTIRVVITNKETGDIYHKDAEEWQGRTDYRGTLELIEEEEGFVVINELPLEEYLYSVVPSEMPASYPMEALKAQAICARTYAYLHVLSPAYPQWNAHVDDTTAFQVYHSVAEQESTNRAVQETEGMVLLNPAGDALAQTYYYSTSCGYGSDAHVWRTKYSDSYPYIISKAINRNKTASEDLTEEVFEEFIKSCREDDYEAEEEWYRWTYEVKKLDEQHIYEVLKQRYEANPKLILTKKKGDYVSQPIKEFGRILDLEIVRREAGGVADELLITTDKNVYKVVTELNIRYILNDGSTKVKRQDGSLVSMNSLIPSAFICLETKEEKGKVTGYTIWGGGYGHGAGMSQNGAKHMALEGMTAQEILNFFFEDCTIEDK